MTKNKDHDLLIEATANIKNIKTNVSEIKEKLENNYATKEQLQAIDDKYKPIKTLVYGFVGLVLLTVIGALLAIVIVQPNL